MLLSYLQTSCNQFINMYLTKASYTSIGSKTSMLTKDKSVLQHFNETQSPSMRMSETRNKLTLCDNSNVIILGGAKLKSPETLIPVPPMTFTAMRRVHLGWFYHRRMHCHLIPVFPAQIYPQIVPLAVGPFQYLFVLSCLLLCYWSQ